MFTVVTMVKVKSHSVIPFAQLLQLYATKYKIISPKTHSLRFIFRAPPVFLNFLHRASATFLHVARNKLVSFSSIWQKARKVSEVILGKDARLVR